MQHMHSPLSCRGPGGGPSPWHLPARTGVPPRRSLSACGTGCDGHGHAVPPVTVQGQSEWPAWGLRVSCARHLVTVAQPQWPSLGARPGPGGCHQ